jgi:hypothetical protein
MLKPKKCFDNVSTRQIANSKRLVQGRPNELSSPFRQRLTGSQFQNFHTVMMNADYWKRRTALIRDGAVRVLSLSTPEEVDYWRDQLKSNRRNSHELR